MQNGDKMVQDCVSVRSLEKVSRESNQTNKSKQQKLSSACAYAQSDQSLC